MRIRKTGWIVWDKRIDCPKMEKGMFVYANKNSAWLSAHKERKGSPYKVVAVTITIKKKYNH